MQWRGYLKICRLIGLFILSGCADDQQFYSLSVFGNSTEQHYPGKFVWHDLLTNDIAAAERFYAGLFGWRFKQTPDSEGVLILNRGRIIGRIVDHFQNTVAAENAVWLSWVSVTDVERATKAAQRIGGEVIEKPQQIEGQGEIALIADSQGAVLALFHSATGDPPETVIQPGDWLWMELWTQDIDKAAYFYKTLFAFSIEPGRQGGAQNYLLLKDGEKQRAGMIQSTLKQIKPNWLPYVRVTDITETISEVTSLGGRVVIPPDPQYDQGRVAVIADPTGGVLAVQQL